MLDEILDSPAVDLEPITPAPLPFDDSYVRRCCMKCTEPLTPVQIANEKTWCVLCDWLLRHERHHPPKTKPTREQLLEIGHPTPGYFARQEWEPVPFDILSVEHWPEVY